MDNNNENYEAENIFHEFLGGDGNPQSAAGMQLAECFGGPVDGSRLPVPIIDGERIEVGTIISGYNHNTGDLMHYRLADGVDSETGQPGLIYQFIEVAHAPNMSFDEFMRRSEDFQSSQDSDF